MNTFGNIRELFPACDGTEYAPIFRELERAGVGRVTVEDGETGEPLALFDRPDCMGEPFATIEVQSGLSPVSRDRVWVPRLLQIEPLCPAIGRFVFPPVETIAVIAQTS